MTSLAKLLLTEDRRESLFRDCARLIHDYVSDRRGVRGLAMKAALSAASAARPDILARASRALVPDFVSALDPLYREFHNAGAGDFSLYLQLHSDRATQALLQAADARVALARNAAARKTYQRLRGSAETEVDALLPRLSRVLARHLG